jgi:hypothetical protein
MIYIPKRTIADKGYNVDINKNYYYVWWHQSKIILLDY